MDSYTYFSDPVHGFIGVNDQLMRLISTREVQRLRRIRQFGSGHLVFPLGEHSRFTHALGAMALMEDALRILQRKGTPISDQERDAAMAAMLLHDIGHSPVSHTLEYLLIDDTSHEEISLALIRRLAGQLGAPVDLAVEMFSGQYERRFFHELIDGQLDMDRLDYLRRDSILSGVIEGRIGVDRVLQTMRVHPADGDSDSHIVIEAKGLHAVENVLTARHHMYNQVYLHKAVLSADYVLTTAISRARELIKRGQHEAVEGISPNLAYFFQRRYTSQDLEFDEVLDTFIKLDDTDIIFSLKQWRESSDPILADFSRRFIDRNLFCCEILKVQPSSEQLANWKRQVNDQYLRKENITEPAAADYYLKWEERELRIYEPDKVPISILHRDQSLKDLAKAGDWRSIGDLKIHKHYLCYPKSVKLSS